MRSRCQSSSLTPILAFGVATLSGCEETFDRRSGAPSPGILIDPASFDFGDVGIGTFRSIEVFIRNDGGSVLSLELGRGRPFSDAFDFRVDREQFPPGGVAVTDLDFSPVDLGEFTSVLEV